MFKKRSYLALSVTALIIGCANGPRFMAPMSKPTVIATANQRAVDLVVKFKSPRNLKDVAPIPSGTPVHHWVAADIHEYRLALWVEDSPSNWVDTGINATVPVANGVAADATLAHLATGNHYKVKVEAWGVQGGATASLKLNSENPAELDYDLSAEQDVPAAIQKTVSPLLDTVPFDGTVKVVPSVPPDTAFIQSELWVVGGADPVATGAVAFVPGTTVQYDGLAAGQHYLVKVKAYDLGDTLIAEGVTVGLFFDDTAQDLQPILSTSVKVATPTPTPFVPTPTPFVPTPTPFVPTPTPTPDCTNPIYQTDPFCLF